MEKRITKKKIKGVLDMLDDLLAKHQDHIEPWADCIKDFSKNQENNGKSKNKRYKESPSRG